MARLSHWVGTASTVGLVSLGLAAVALPASPATAARESRVVRAITFPVNGKVGYYDTFADCRDGGCPRHHEGNDLIGSKLMPLVAAASGVIDWVNLDSGTAGNALSIKDSDGWRYLYLHINNDTPGTNDNTNPEQWRFAPGIEAGASVVAGQLIAYMGNSGNAEFSVPHLHFEIHEPNDTVISPYDSLRVAQGFKPRGAAYGGQCAASTNPVQPTLQSKVSFGYRVITADSRSVAFGRAAGLKNPRYAATATAAAMRPTGKGYWAVRADGTFTAVGDAPAVRAGSLGRKKDPVVAAVGTASGTGFWRITRSGFVAPVAAPVLTGTAVGPVVAAVASPTGTGLWTVSASGFISALGDASPLPAANLPRGRAVSIAANPSGTGAWVLTNLGDVVPVGGAPDLGAPSREGLCLAPFTASIHATAGAGYVVAGVDGSVWAYGDARWVSDLPDRALKTKGVLAIDVVSKPSAPTTPAPPSESTDQ